MRAVRMIWKRSRMRFAKPAGSSAPTSRPRRPPADADTCGYCAFRRIDPGRSACCQARFRRRIGWYFVTQQQLGRRAQVRVGLDQCRTPSSRCRPSGTPVNGRPHIAEEHDTIDIHSTDLDIHSTDLFENER